MIQAAKLQWATDSTAQREGLMWQLLERSELDTDYVLIKNTEIEVNLNRVDGINEVVLSYPSTPVDASTTLTIKAVTKQDSKPFTGALFSDFLVTKNGTEANPTAGDDSALAGTYVLTVAALATNDDLASKLYNNADNRESINLDNDLFKSNTATTTVVAP